MPPGPAVVGQCLVSRRCWHGDDDRV